MPVRWAIANGDFNNTSTWNDGATLGIPTTGDDVYANGFTVNMNANAAVQSLNNSVLTAQSTRLNPVMTTNTTPSGVATSSTNGSIAFDAFDGNTSGTATEWVSSAPAPQWIQYQFTSPLIIRSYSIWYSIAARPTSFNLQGSNDGISFVTLDSRTGFVFTSNQFNTLTITNPTTAYSYYRLNITATDVVGNPAIPELTFNEAGITTTAGGSFNFNTAGVTVSATSSTASLSAGATNLITVTATTGTVTLNLSSFIVPPGIVSSVLILQSGNCNLTLTAPRMSNGVASSAIVLNKTGTGNTIINSILSSGTIVTSSFAINTAASGTITINGDIIGNTFSGASSHVVNQTSGTLIVNGDVIGSLTNSTTYGINFSGTSLTVNGNVLGGNVGSAILTSSATNTITGTVTAGGVAAISSTSANTINVIGDVYASATAVGISSTNASGVVNLTGNMYNGLGRNAIYCQNIFISDTATTLWRMDTGGGAYKYLYSADTTPNLPSITDVRFGTTFGPALSLTGTMVVLSAANTRKGVATDNTVGTAELTSADIISGINASSDSLAVRLKNILTDQSAGNIISQYKDS